MNIRSVISLLACLIFLLPRVVVASEIDDRISELSKKIIELQSQQDSLSKQINLLDSQIKLASLRISAIQDAIGKLSSEISELVSEIERIEEMLTKRSSLVLHRIPESYKASVTPQFGLVFISRNFHDFLSRLKYVSRVQEQDAQLLFQLKATQNHFSERKNLREQKKIKQESLRKELEIATREMENQKRNKQVLLDQTKNDESVYQKLLSQALSERQALERALVDAVKIGPVKSGDPIAIVGNTGYPGCSTGAHLHLEIRRNNVWTDPAEFLSSKNVNDEQNGGSAAIGGGSWNWPLADTIRLTQHFGKTPYSWRYEYSGGIHTGFDMISTSSDIIRAPSDGVLYSSSQPCGSGSIIKIKYIDHGNGVLSFYLHVQ